jgi:hypothetical protein
MLIIRSNLKPIYAISIINQKDVVIKQIIEYLIE